MRVCMYVCVCLCVRVCQCVQPLTNPALEFKVLYRNLDKGERDCESQIKAESNSKRERERGAVRAREAHSVWSAQGKTVSIDVSHSQCPVQFS